MPRKPKRPCSYPGCPKLSEDRYCPEHKRKVEKEYYKKRGSAASHGYDGRWRRARKSFLSVNPLCAVCFKAGRITPATVVDHVKPHKGDMTLFWDESNWQVLCKTCHDRKTAKDDGRWGK